ncbi:phenylacetate--CoA ligase family protein [Natrialbaceae archaeon A-gly3]
MTEYVERINEVKPYSIEAYVESINELSKHIEREELDVHSPRGILSTAGTLHPTVRKRVEDVFDTVVLNKYGSREVGDIACECPQQGGLHIFDHTHYVEVVDKNGDPLPPGEEGELAITVLTNYSMPLIRYRIGDMGVLKEGKCTCSKPFSMLEDVTGRVSDHFLSTDGKLVYGALFRHLLFHKSWIEKFQVRQVEQDKVIYHIVVADEHSPLENDIQTIKKKTREVLGSNVSVHFEYVDRIQSSKSGKYRYTISEVVEN